MDISILTIVFSMILSGIVSVVISIFYYRVHENHLRKLEVFREFMGNRYVLIKCLEGLDPSLFYRALNQIGVMYKSKEIGGILESMLRDIKNHGKIDDNLLVKLYKVMCKELNIKIEHLTDEFFLNPFAPRKYMKRLETEKREIKD